MAARPGLLFLVNSLVAGGAEKHAIALLNELDVDRFRLSAAWLKPDETLLPQIDSSRLEALWCCNVARKLDQAAVERLAERIEALRIDVLVAVNAYSALYGLLAQRRCRRPLRLVEIFHTTLILSWKERAQMWIYRRVFRRFDLLIYVCRNQYNYWRSRGLAAKTETVIYNGVDVARFTSTPDPAALARVRSEFGLAEADYVIGICASLRPEKAHGDLLAAIARLRARGIRAACLIIGDGPERRNIERRIDALGLRDSARITGFQADVRPLVACCDVMALVSHGVETFSIAALESMAMGKPLVMTDIGGAAEQITPAESGYLYRPGDIDSLVLHLTTLADPQRRALMGAAARRRVEEMFTESRMLATYTKQLATLASTL